MLHYKIHYNTPKTFGQRVYDKFSILKKSSPIEVFNTQEDVNYIEAYTLELNNILDNYSITKHNTGKISIYGKYAKVEGITAGEYGKLKAGLDFMNSNLRTLYNLSNETEFRT